MDGALYSFTRNQVDYVTNRQGRLLVDFVGRFERLEADVAAVFAEIGLGEPELPHKNRSKRRGHYSAFYTPETEEIVRERFNRDIEYFGYEFERVSLEQSAELTEESLSDPQSEAQEGRSSGKEA